MQRKPAWAPIYAEPVFNTLVQHDPTKAEISPNTIVGSLAERWETSKDGLTWTFYLAKGVKWHDGKPFTADDVVYTIEKLKDPARSASSSVFSAVAKAARVDDSTVTVTLARPWAAFLTNLCLPYSSVLPKHTADVDWKTTAFLVGTGPFKFKKMTSGVSFELERNPSYFRKDAAGRQLPYLDGITVYYMDRDPYLSAFIAGRLDMLTPVFGITNLDLQKRYDAQATKDMSFDWHRALHGTLIFLNCAYEPLKNAKVRQAVALMYDRDAATTGTYGVKDWTDGSQGIFGGSYGLGKAGVYAALGWDKPYDARVEAAKKLMQEAGYANGFKLKMISNQIPEMQKTNLWLADALRKLNIDAQVGFPDTATLVKELSTGDFGSHQQSTNVLFGDPDDLMGWFMTGSTGNFMKYSNPAADKLWTEQSATMDPSQRMKLVQQLEQILLNDAVAIPIGGSVWAHVQYNYVKGYVLQQAAYASAGRFELAWLDK